MGYASPLIWGDTTMTYKTQTAVHELTVSERAFCYRYFSEFFRGIMPEALDHYWPILCSILGIDAPLMRFDQKFAQDWARTFFGVGNETVTLTQSSWQNALRLHCQEPCLSARNAYSAAGVAPQLGQDALPEDHISVMLGFMAWAMDRHDPATEFFQDHFSGWCDSFIEAAMAHLDNDTASHVLRAFALFIEGERVRFVQDSQPTIHDPQGHA